jgi:4-alpha-glucanotransferase
MADSWGIDDRYEDAAGELRRAPVATVERLRRVIGRPPADSPAVLVVRPDGGDRRVADGPAELTLEDGTRVALADGVLPPDVPIGYHTVRTVAAPETAVRPVIVSPGRCHPVPRRMWGWAVQLYAARSRASWGMGDLADLAALARWSAADGAGFLLVNPLRAVAPTAVQQPSPYFPASRRFLNPLYLRVEDVPGAGELDGDQIADAAIAGRALDDERIIDRDAVWRLKRSALEAVWARTIGRHGPAGDPDFARWRDAQGPALAQFATWCVLAERHGPDWRTWPAALRHPDDPAVTRAAAEDADRAAFHAWLQWLTQDQLRRASEHLAMVHDLPIGFDPGGVDAWAWQDILAEGVTVGAPPDEFNTAGQDWGLPPFVPWKLEAAAFGPFVETIRAGLLAAGGLRVDHVMGLFRLWWIPHDDGASATTADATRTDPAVSGPAAGAYVRYPSEALLDVLALESVRAQAFVVGEDLGTVEDGVREALRERDVLSYRLVWFEDDRPSAWPPEVMAAVTTHDLPTVAGLWTGDDLVEQRAVGQAPNEEGTAAIRARLAEQAGLDPVAANAADAVRGAYHLLAEAPARLLAAALDDAVAEPRRPNIPGADGDRPNWSLTLPVPIEDLVARPLARDLAATLGRATRARDPHESRTEPVA